jgi:hypothetical protein
VFDVAILRHDVDVRMHDRTRTLQLWF